jgi:hypothetical protein
MPSPQTPSNPSTAPDPGFKLPGEPKQDASHQPVPDTSASDAVTQPVEVAPAAVASHDTSSRDLAIGGAVFVVLLVIYFFVRNAYVHHLVVRRVAPASAGSAGWLLFVGLGFLSLAAVLAVINASRFLALAITGPLVVAGVLALVAALFIGRR